MKKLTYGVVLGFAVTACLVGTSTAASADPELQPQTITITSEAPTGAIWNRTSNLGDYVPSAVSTSGLPVRLSVDPASTGCYGFPGVIGEPGSEEAGDRITVRWIAPGTCTIWADQAGDEQYAPAERVVQSFEIGKEPVSLTAAKAGKAFLGLTSTTFKAELKHETRFGPGYLTIGYPDQTITFSVAGKVLCSATTVMQGDLFNSTAVATCKAPIGLGNAFAKSTYTATYAGNDLSLGATATGKLG